MPDTFWKYLVREIVGEKIVIYNHGELRVILDLNIKQYDAGTSLVVQWLRLHALMQGHGFHPWSENLIPHGATMTWRGQILFKCLHQH